MPTGKSKEYLEVGTGARVNLPDDAETKRRLDNGEIREMSRDEVAQAEQQEKLAGGPAKSEHDRVR